MPVLHSRFSINKSASPFSIMLSRGGRSRGAWVSPRVTTTPSSTVVPRTRNSFLSSRPLSFHRLFWYAAPRIWPVAGINQPIVTSRVPGSATVRRPVHGSGGAMPAAQRPQRASLTMMTRTRSQRSTQQMQQQEV